MKFSIDKHERYVVLKPLETILNGEKAQQIKSEFILLNTDGQRNIVLDLSEIKKVDSSGLRCALMAHRLCKAAGGVFVVCCANDDVARLISLSQLDDVLMKVPSQLEAEDIIFMEEIEKELRGSVRE